MEYERRGRVARGRVKERLAPRRFWMVLVVALALPYVSSAATRAQLIEAAPP